MTIIRKFTSLALFAGLFFESSSSSRLVTETTRAAYQDRLGVDFAPAPQSRRLQACAADGEKSKQCGANRDDRPELCCADLVCNNRNECEVEICAEQGEVAKDCGAQQNNRAQSCCAGLSCGDDKRCVASQSETSPDQLTPTATAPAPVAAPILVPTEAVPCAADGELARDCGANINRRPQSCCFGLICNDDKKVCASPGMPDAAGPDSTAPGGGECAAVDERAIACGANRKDRPQLCCPGLECDMNEKTCIVIPTLRPTRVPSALPNAAKTSLPTSPPTLAVAPTPSPSEDPTPEPTITPPTLQPTYEPTPEPSREPTVEPNVDTRSPTPRSAGEVTNSRIASAIMVITFVALMIN